ncbi:hypothetical protein ABET41_01010 [Metabacillus fastidiosus]|uniref:Uncharacterized protein n=1 Tax=Metabacillus fastidiosus TaxID=1458 RepID=A0ABU6P1E2_9BACI|nr:hypothetical protein [Metabacillus fastidiosus]MED4455409.1 hypothetical protein [Metabacillus fastidiosus]
MSDGFINKKEDALENTEITEEQEDRFTKLMFGTNYKKRNRLPVQKEEIKEEPDEINYLHLMGQIDDIMTSINNLKPVLEHLSPIVNFIKKKK